MRKPKGKKQKSVCKMPGCVGVTHGKGFCRLHYVRYRRGIYAEDGTQLRDVGRSHPFNQALSSTLRLVRRARRNAEYITTEMAREDEVHLNEPRNLCLRDINEETAAQEPKLINRNFVFSNIHLLNPATLQLIVGNQPVKKVSSLSHFDEARIAWHILKGRKAEEIAAMFPAYSTKQVRSVDRKIKSGTLSKSAAAIVKGRRL